MPASIKHLTDKKLNITSLLAKWRDGLYYTAAIVECDKTNKRCFVCFEDGSEVWVKNRDLHLQITLDQLNDDDDIVCCFCDDGTSQAPNEIILCDVCNQGYHQKCHNPPVDASTIDDSDDTNDHKDWICSTCTYILNQSDRAGQSSGAQKRPHEQEAPAPPQKQPKIAAIKESEGQQQQQQQQQQKQSTPTSVPVPQQPKPKQQQAVQPPAAVQTKQPVKVKQTPTSQQQHSAKPTAGSPKPTVTNIVQKQAPYYPLSSQVRAAVTTSPAGVTPVVAVAASSTLVVGNPVGRSKQDVVNQSNKSTQRQRQLIAEPQTSPNASQLKHAARKSSINFTPPVRQSALPVATRSPIPNLTPAAKSPRPNPASGIPVIVSAPNNSGSVHCSAIESTTNNMNTSSSTANVVTLIPKQASPILAQFSETSLVRGGMDTNNKVGDSNGGPVLQVLEPRAKAPIVTSTQISSTVGRPAAWPVESQLVSTHQKPVSSPSFPLAKISSVIDGIPISTTVNSGNGSRVASSAKVVSSSTSRPPTSSTTTEVGRPTSGQSTAVLNTNSNPTGKSS